MKMENKVNRIFLGGTCAQTTWREDLIKKLDGTMDYFNPVVDDWTPECQEIEVDEKENKCNVHLYCITSAMVGVFSIAEVVDSVHDESKHTILQVMPEGFSKPQLKSLQAVVDLVNKRGGIAFIDGDITVTSNLLQVINVTE